MTYQIGDKASVGDKCGIVTAINPYFIRLTHRDDDGTCVPLANPFIDGPYDTLKPCECEKV